MAQRTSARSIAFLFLIQPFLAACGDTFEPFAPSELVFSIHGALDATADTQWVRVRPPQASQETLTGTLDAVVTLEEVETGTVVQMSDSIFRYESPNLDELGVSGHNFFTTMPMVPGRHYRLTATRPDGATSTATVLVPPAVNPVLQVTHFTDPRLAPRGMITGFPHIAMIFGDSDVPMECNYFAPVYRQFFTPQESSTGDSYSFALVDTHPPKLRMLPEPPPTCRLRDERILIIGSGERWEWPRGYNVGLDEALFPDATTNNIEGGVGFLAGINRLVFPRERCVPVSGSSCNLFYTPLSATLVGKAVDSCTGLPVADANVQLLASGDNAIRATTTDDGGVFRISSLNAGPRHTLTLTRSTYFDYALEPLVFEAQAIDTVAVELRSRLVCRT